MPHRTARFRLSFAFLAGTRLVINTASRFVSLFLPAIGRGLGIPLARAGDLISVRWVGALPTPLFITALARGRPRRTLIGLGSGLFAVGALVTASSGVYVGALLGFLLMGIAKPLFDVSSQAYLADRIPYERRGRYLGIFELTWAGALLVGAPFAGWLIRIHGWAAPFWFTGAALVLGLLLVARLLDSDAGDVAGVAGRLTIDGPSLAFLLVVGLYAAAAEMMFVVVGAWLEDSFGLSLVAVGGIAVFIGLAEFGGESATALFADAVGKRRSVLAGIVIAAAGFVLFAIVNRSLLPGTIGVMIAYFGFELAIVSGIPYASEIHPHARARFLALMVVAMAIGRTLGTIAGPRLFTGPGLATTAYVAAALNLAAAVVLLLGRVPESVAAERSVANSPGSKQGG